MEGRIVYCSCPAAAADELAKAVVGARLGACVQVIPQIRSTYWWKGELCQDDESLLVVKTEARLVGKLTSLLKEKHPYEVPEVIAVATAPGEGDPAYFAWMAQVLEAPP
ncbi:MAG: divalent-cation tolerance protein CutA [Deltaproteobacteria bacterium]|nr:divalent-cation tolerance protein CutA [Deltaproteobacteria bacterium]